MSFVFLIESRTIIGENRRRKTPEFTPDIDEKPFLDRGKAADRLIKLRTDFPWTEFRATCYLEDSL